MKFSFIIYQKSWGKYYTSFYVNGEHIHNLFAESVTFFFSLSFASSHLLHSDLLISKSVDEI